MKQHEKIFLSIIIAVIVFLVIMLSIKANSVKPSAKSDDIDLDSIEEVYSSVPVIEEKQKEPQIVTWNKSEDIDQMTDKKTRYAWLKSMDYINQRFPYEGDTYLKMTIREMGSTDVYFTITKGQIQCSEYSGTNYVMVRFDNEQPIKFWTAEASSGRSDIVFISGNVKKFVSKCKKAKEIKVQIPIYDYGNPIFNFYVNTPLEW